MTQHPGRLQGSIQIGKAVHLEDVLGPVYAISLASGDAWVSLGLRALAAGSCPVTSLANSSSNVLTVKQCCLWMHLDEQRVSTFQY